MTILQNEHDAEEALREAYLCMFERINLAELQREREGIASGLLASA